MPTDIRNWSGAAVLATLLLLAQHLQADEPPRPSGQDDRVQEIAALRAGFAQPPREAGPWVYWFWFDNVVSREEITREIGELVSAGIAGAELRFVVADGFPGFTPPWFAPEGWQELGQKKLEYLSPEFCEMLAHTCAEAKRCGLKLAINLGMGWPPGGPWITDRYRAKHLQSDSQVLDGPRKLPRGNLSVPAGAMVFAWQIASETADQQVVPDSFRDLSDQVDLQGSLEWEVPAGRWLIGIYHYTLGGICDKGNGPEADPGSRDAVLFHLNYLFSRIEPYVAKYFGTTLTEVATDSWEYTPSSTGRYCSPALFDTYAALHNEDLKARLYCLEGYGPDRAQVLERMEMAERFTVQQNFYQTVTDYLHARGLRHRPQVRGRGLARDFFEAYAACDIPEIEEEVCLPEAVWTAHLLGKPIVSAEAFTFISGHRSNLLLDGERQHRSTLEDASRKWETNLALLRSHANAHFARGINRIQMHSFSYSPPGLPAPGWRMYAEVHLNRNVPWWPYLNRFSTWVARSQFVLQSGRPVADLLVYPVRPNPPDGPFAQAEDQPVSALNAIDGLSRQLLPQVAAVPNENTAEPQNILVLDAPHHPNEIAWLLDAAERGVQVYWSREAAVSSQNWPDAAEGREGVEQVKQLQHRLRQATDRGKIIHLSTSATEWSKVAADVRSVRWSPIAANLSFQHRRIAGADIYFLMNWGDPFSGWVSFPHTGLSAELWDAECGTTLPAGVYRFADHRTEVMLDIPALGSAIVVFAEPVSAVHCVNCDGAEVVPLNQEQLRVSVRDSRPHRLAFSDGRTVSLQVNVPPPINVNRGWRVSAGPERGVGLDASVQLELDTLSSWQAITPLQYFSGTASYTVSVDVPTELTADHLGLELDLGDVFELADIWIGDRHAGTSWFAPHRIDVTDLVEPGRNALRIEVPNILKNHLERENCSRPSGLLGPVQLIPYARLTVNVPTQ